MNPLDGLGHYRNLAKNGLRPAFYILYLWFNDLDWIADFGVCQIVNFPAPVTQLTLLR